MEVERLVTLDEAVIARLERSGVTLEILVDPEIALSFREKRGAMELDLDDLLAAEFVFTDARAADKASVEEMQKGSGSSELEDAVRVILMDGDLQLTTDQRRRMVERKRKLIVQRIAQNAINPQTKTPHPPDRIRAAMEEARVHVDPFKSVDAQIQDVLKALRPLIPIRFENVTIAVKLPAEEAGKAYGLIRGWGELKQEEWQSDGSWVGLVEMPAGMQGDFYDDIGKRTQGQAETKVVRSSP